MTNTVDFQKSFDAVQSLMNLQAAAITKSIEQQKKSGEELTSFFQSEAEKAKELKTPEELIKFNMEANKALFELLKSQGEAFTSIANETREAAMAELQSMTK
ncbi:hypothetical protein [Neptuniibacter sp.]|uniref:hypothetical protein n=1 Tax=Neptuniibacter sp. TaxID=1962643 RepID=UPI00262CD0C0|nr:hypothetical protein [Neptuniibacter sp.]MCP4598845.1 hypothetical protein [Neptuniibacter sp.]